MKWIVLGDIGRSDFYHLGDEAMTEVAVEMLGERGATEVTLVTSDVETATTMYGLPAVSRAKFEWDTGRTGCESLLAEISESARAEQWTSDTYGPLLSALQSADAALIAGGGNMNSQYYHLLYERLAFVRAAEQLGIPVFITSQTVGPELCERDEEIVRELLEIAVCFGAREQHSAALLRALTENPAKVVHTYDDAVLLSSGSEDRRFLEMLPNRDRSIVASFTEDQGSSGMTEEDYVQSIASLLDNLAFEYDADALLVPHAGTFAPRPPARDQLLNKKVVAESRSGRVKEIEMPTAREYAALLEGVLGSISTRYHPVVFCPQAGVPTVGISLSTYSSVRMRGALANLGRERFVVPSLLWRHAEEACHDAIAVEANSVSPKIPVAAYQESWWDAIVQAAVQGAWNGFADLAPPAPLAPQGTWTEEVESVTPVFEMWGRERQRVERIAQERNEWRRRALQAEGRRVVRLVDRITRIGTNRS